MLKSLIGKVFLPSILLVLAYGFWISPNFKQISAGVGIFLFGMLSLEQGFKAFTGGRLENMLARSTDTYWKSLGFGALTTSIMQSSSLVSVISISFISAGLISLTAGVGIIFGANLGTTTGAWLVAGFGLKVDISAYAMPMIVFGVILVFQRSKSLKGMGYVLTGLGFLFLGIHYMKEGFDAFSETIDLKAYAVDGYPGIFLFVLIGLVATVVMQSSHATLVLTITALAAEQITYENGLALAIGSNVGTTVTAIIGSLSGNVNGRRLVGAHLIFNLVTAAIAIAFIYPLSSLVDTLSAWLGIANDNYTLKLAVFHTIFNVVGILIMSPFINLMVTFLERVLKPTIRTSAQPQFLHNASIDFPETAIEAVRNETLHLYDNAFKIIAGGIRLRPEWITPNQNLDNILTLGNRSTPIDIKDQYTQTIKSLYSQIIDYISRTQANLTPDQSDELFSLRSAGQDIVEAIKDISHLHKNLDRYLVSPNPSIKNEYAAIRAELASILQTLSVVREQGNDSSAILSLDGLQQEMRQRHQQLTSKTDNLIRNNQITAEMATSLMNDSHYAHEAANNLIEIGRLLFSTGDINIRSAERSLALEQHEIDEALQPPQESL